MLLDPILAPDFVDDLWLKDYLDVIESLYNFVPQDKGWQTKYIYIKINNYND